MNVTATACIPQCDTCMTWLEGPWGDFNSIFGGAPIPDAEGNCPFNEITEFEVWASESYSVDNFIEGIEYTFSMCNGSFGAWVPELAVIDTAGNIVAWNTGECEISWVAAYSGTYLIGINEADFCGSASSNTATDNGFPALTCDGTVGVEELANAEFSIYPNPNNGQFTIVNDGVNGDYLIEIVDITGKVVYSENSTLTTGERTNINPDNVEMGVYMVRLTNTQESYYRTLRMIIR
jgi:hypothetical protein